MCHSMTYYRPRDKNDRRSGAGCDLARAVCARSISREWCGQAVLGRRARLLPSVGARRPFALIEDGVATWQGTLCIVDPAHESGAVSKQESGT